MSTLIGHSRSSGDVWGSKRDSVKVWRRDYAGYQDFCVHILTVKPGEILSMVSVAELLDDPAINAYLRRMIGDDGIEVLRRFPGDEEHSDEELAEITGINLNTVRHTLYTLYEKRLAEYRRLKNIETGWLTYLWHLRLDRIYDVIEEDLRDAVEKLGARLAYEETNDFYMCRDCSVIYTFADAADWSFTCPNCDATLEHFDNELLVAALRKRVEKIRESLGSA